MNQDEITLGFRFCLGREPRNISEIEQYADCKDAYELKSALVRDNSLLMLGERYSERAIVFIHLMKTAGHSLTAIIAPQIESRRILFVEQLSDLYGRSVAELSQFDYIYGHFFASDCVMIPRRSKFVFSFFREPFSRLISYYRYAKAHPTDSALMHDAAFQAAKAMEPEDFFRSPEAVASSAVNNHYLNVYGAPVFSGWDCIGKPNEEIRTRLRAAIDSVAKLDFIGLQERFEQDVERLMRELDLEMPAFLVKINEAGSLWRSGPGYEAAPDVKLTPRLQEIMSPLVEYDLMIFEAAKAEAHRRCAAPAIEHTS